MTELLLLDLDGTLVDTAPDMGAALNRLLQEEGRPALPPEHIRPQVSNGAHALVSLGFGTQRDDPEHSRLRDRFLDLYAEGVARDSVLFEGFGAVLDALEGAGGRWGIVTNKPGALTEPLIAKLGLTQRSVVTVSGDTVDRAKPHPDPLLHACGNAGVAPGSCLYVGDAERDILAARSAGMSSAVALWGYIDGSEDVAAWGADHVLQRPEGLLPLLGLER